MMWRGLMNLLRKNAAVAICLMGSVGSLAATRVESKDGVPKDYRAPSQLNPDPLYAGRRLSEWALISQSDNDDLRLCAVRALGELGSEAKGVVPWLIDRLDDRDQFIRSTAANSLGNIGPDAGIAASAMLKAFNNSSGFFKGIIGPAMARIGPRGTAALIELSRDPDKYDRWEAARALRLLGPEAAEAESQLVGLLQDDYHGTRVEAALALWKIRKQRSSIDFLAQALRDPDEFTRMTAADALAQIGLDALPALPALIEALDDESDAVGGGAARVLTKFGPAAKAAIPKLSRLAGNRTTAGSWFVLVVREVGPEVIPCLLDLLDNNPSLGPVAAALGQFGTQAQLAAPRLRSLLPGLHGEERVKVALALWQVGRDAAAITALTNLLRHDNFLTRARAFEALGEIGPDARTAVPTLIERLGHDSQFVREAAAKALGRMGVDASAAVPKLEEVLRDAEMSNRIAAAKALWVIARSQAALQVLFKDARCTSDSTYTFAVLALGEIGPEASEAVPALIAALEVESIFAKAIAAQALGQIGPAARSAVPALIEIHNDPRNTERSSFATVILKLDRAAGACEGIRAPAPRTTP